MIQINAQLSDGPPLVQLLSTLAARLWQRTVALQPCVHVSEDMISMRGDVDSLLESTVQTVHLESQSEERSIQENAKKKNKPINT